MKKGKPILNVARKKEKAKQSIRKERKSLAFGKKHAIFSGCF
jgi:hypothetical protein